MDNLEIMKAWEYAKVKHNKQVRSGTTDVSYFTHCQNVFNIVSQNCDDPTINKTKVQLLALLHDTIEDTDATYDDIEAMFGKDIADGVWALTKDDSLPKNERLRDSIQKIQNQDQEVAIVKMSDRIDNISTLNPLWDYSGSLKYLQESKLLLSELGSSNIVFGKLLNQAIIKYEKLIEDNFSQHEKRE